MNLYILRGRKPVSIMSPAAWGKWMGAARVRGACRVGDTTINGYRVSTVFLGVDHNFGANGPPLLFETMTFDEDREGGAAWMELGMRRYPTWEAAEAGHAEAVAHVRAALGLPAE